jgi:hypothetical protein
MGGNPGRWPLDVWLHAAQHFVRPIGCDISDIHAGWRMGGTWEVTYVCPDQVDLRALIKAQRSDLKRGVPLHR